MYIPRRPECQSLTIKRHAACSPGCLLELQLCKFPPVRYEAQAFHFFCCNDWRPSPGHITVTDTSLSTARNFRTFLQLFHLQGVQLLDMPLQDIGSKADRPTQCLQQQRIDARRCFQILRFGNNAAPQSSLLLNYLQLHTYALSSPFSCFCLSFSTCKGLRQQVGVAGWREANAIDGRKSFQASGWFQHSTHLLENAHHGECFSVAHMKKETHEISNMNCIK